jgi:hypothetical protein
MIENLLKIFTNIYKYNRLEEEYNKYMTEDYILKKAKEYNLHKYGTKQVQNIAKLYKTKK